ncbi:unnamed protein product [Pleuronectes platessa]|uniref:Uncharacterized protein n=1 Tax=Pleuronectes platessa TaxID=8262 RepID=A0A9N7V610_PLEPL|nr:unnamed protein product [Pleuronectes platessa]
MAAGILISPRSSSLARAAPAYLTVSRPADAQIGSSSCRDRNKNSGHGRHKGQAGRFHMVIIQTVEEQRGVESGAGSSPGQPLPAALPLLHRSVTPPAKEAPGPSPQCPQCPPAPPPPPPPPPSLVSSKLLQSAQGLIGLGQWSLCSLPRRPGDVTAVRGGSTNGSSTHFKMENCPGKSAIKGSGV